MQIENLLKNFPNISLATDQNNEEILEFFNQFSLHSDPHNAEKVHYHRDPDFFSLLRARGESDLTFLLREEDGRIQGIAAVTLRKGFIAGKEEWVGYLGDLRVSLNRNLIRQWRNCFKAFLESSPELIETNGCKYYQTALMDTNSYSKANLASNKLPGVHYNLLSNYNMVNILGLLGMKRRIKGFSVLPLTKLGPSYRKEVLNFFKEREKELPFGHLYPEGIEHRLKTWPDFSDENILVLYRTTGEFLGATFYYDPIKLKRMSLSKIPFALKLSRMASLTLPFYKQAKLPKANEEVSVLYLENGHTKKNLYDDHLYGLALQYLLGHKKFNMVAITEWHNHPLDNALKGFITHKTAMGLYTVHPTDKEGNPLFIEELASENYPESSYPRFDMAMV